MKKIYKHLFFDLDRTFWDVDKNQKKALEEIYNTFSMDRYFGEFDNFYGKFIPINEKLWVEYRDGAVSREGLRNGRFVKLLSVVDIHDESLALDISGEYLRVSPMYNELLDNSHDILEYLYSKNYPMSLITNGFNEVQFHKVKYSKIDKYFNRIVTSEFAGVNKPSAGIFEYAMRKAGVKSCEAIMIGDDPYSDVYGALNVGLDCVYLNVNKNQHDLNPTYEISSLIDLKSIF